MKKLLSILLLSSFVILTSCHKDEIIEVNQSTQIELDLTKNVEVNFKATVVTTPKELYDGETVNISLKDITGLDVLDKAEYNGKDDYSFEIEYFVDGKSIGTSSSKNNGFAINYKVENLQVGTHTVSASCKTGKKVTCKTMTINAASFDVIQKKANTVNVSLGTAFSITKDLFEFVVPTISYTDSKGLHNSVITSDICEEDNYTIGEKQYHYYSCDQNIGADLVPDETYELTLTFSPKAGVAADAEKRYNQRIRFVVKKYSFAFNNLIHIGNISNININIDIKVNQDPEDEKNDDGLISGKYVAEYVKQLCASPQTIKVKLTKEGKLVLGDKEY